MEEFYTTAKLISIATFTLTTTLTPGPNNIMLMSSGLTFGYKNTVPHMIGVILGFSLMVILVGLGIGIVFEQFSIVLSLLKIIGIIYLIWMSYKIATNTNRYEIDENGASKPFSFFQAAIFQWVNPKAWIVLITAVSIFTTANDNSLVPIFIIAFLYFLAGIVACNLWTLGGVMLKKLLRNNYAIKTFNISMAVLLILSIIPFIVE